MKMVKAIIKPERFEFVKKALEDKGFIGMTISEVKGRGEQKGIALQYRGGLMIVDLLPENSVGNCHQASDVDTIVVTITEAAPDGKIGMARYSSLPVEKSMGIRTGEMET